MATWAGADHIPDCNPSPLETWRRRRHNRPRAEEFLQVEPRQLVGSLDSAHGVIRLALRSPQYLFISGITNRLGYFRMELAPRFYAQNLVASHNAAIALALDDSRDYGVVRAEVVIVALSRPGHRRRSLLRLQEWTP
jgi:hypothetical protein